MTAQSGSSLPAERHDEERALGAATAGGTAAVGVERVGTCGIGHSDMDEHEEHVEHDALLGLEPRSTYPGRGCAGLRKTAGRGSPCGEGGSPCDDGLFEEGAGLVMTGRVSPWGEGGGVATGRFAPRGEGGGEDMGGEGGGERRPAALGMRAAGSANANGSSSSAEPSESGSPP